MRGRERVVREKVGGRRRKGRGRGMSRERRRGEVGEKEKEEEVGKEEGVCPSVHI